MVESTALEMRRARKGTVGSNPTLSANSAVCVLAICVRPYNYPNKRKLQTSSSQRSLKRFGLSG